MLQPMYHKENERSKQISFEIDGFGYQDVIDENAEKFRVWGNKCFFDRRQAFDRIVMFDGFHSDKLSILIANEMTLLLEKSEVAP